VIKIYVYLALKYSRLICAAVYLVFSTPIVFFCFVISDSDNGQGAAHPEEGIDEAADSVINTIEKRRNLIVPMRKPVPKTKSYPCSYHREINV
jgi:hypothetical protein